MRIELDPSGWTIFVITEGDDGRPHRRPLNPGLFNEQKDFVPTDLSGEPDEVLDACRAAWTPEVIEAYKTNLAGAFP